MMDDALLQKVAHCAPELRQRPTLLVPLRKKKKKVCSLRSAAARNSCCNTNWSSSQKKLDRYVGGRVRGRVWSTAETVSSFQSLVCMQCSAVQWRRLLGYDGGRPGECGERVLNLLI